MKRRKLNDTSSALLKPFKSPVIKRQTTDQADTEHAEEPNTPTGSILRQVVTLSNRPTSTTSPLKDPAPSPIVSRSSKSSVASGTAQNFSTAESRDPDVEVHQEQHRMLLLQLKMLKDELHTAQSALKIVKSNQELEQLITKWKRVSRAAAEEVFETAREKIDGMGGVRAWRERSSKRPQGWEEEDPGLDDLTNEQREEVQMRREEMQEEAEKYGLNEPEEEETVEDDNTFTMEMMLRSMGIDLGLIGYDKDSQTWKD